MASPPQLPAGKLTEYCDIIDHILAKSDLTTISSKRIRKMLEKEVGRDLSEEKDAINALIDQRFDKAYDASQHAGTAEPNVKEPSTTDEHRRQENVVNGKHPDATSNGVDTSDATASINSVAASDAAATSNGVVASTATKDVRANVASAVTRDSPSIRKRRAPTDEPSELTESTPLKKKHRKTESTDNDEAIARRMQEEENGRARTTRGGGANKKKPVAKKEKKRVKSKAKVDSDDDDEDGTAGKKMRANRNSGFHKPLLLSAPLAALLGETQLSRPQTVSKIWQYIKANGLQDANNKQMIICDEAMKTVFKVDKVNMFQMNKLLGQNLYSADE